MQTKRLHKKFHIVRNIDANSYSKEAYDREYRLKLFIKLRKSGCSEEIALEAIGWSRSKYHRLKKRYRLMGLLGLEHESRKPNNTRKPTWSKRVEKLVLKIRRKEPVWGKAKIKRILERDYQVSISESSVGRILSKLIKQKKIMPAWFHAGHNKRKPRNFKGHAKRLQYGMKAKKPGQYMQFDHMSEEISPGTWVKHFRAVCPITKYTYERPYTRATALNAQDFLQRAILYFPFKIESIQVDGGSEFRAEFEDFCQQSAIDLFVLPPRKPELNGCVERGNGTSRIEFYLRYHGPATLSRLRENVEKWVKKYNTYRPHQALQQLTPLEYYENTWA